MNRSGIRMTSVSLALLLAAVGLGLVAGPASAATRKPKAKARASLSISSTVPLQRRAVTATVRAYLGSKVVRGASVTFTWTIGGKAYRSKVRTNRSGYATSVRNIGEAPPWQTARVVASTLISRSAASSKASFTAMPDPVPGHPLTLDIGVVVPKTVGDGRYRAVQLAIEQANADPSIAGLGLKFSSLRRDDRGREVEAPKVARGLAASKSVIGIVGHPDSACSLAAAGVYTDAGLPMVSPTATGDDLTILRLASVFRTTYSDDSQGPGAAAAAYKLGYRKAMVVDDGSQQKGALADAFSERFAALGGAVVGRREQTPEDEDYSYLMSAVEDKEADLVYFTGSPASAAGIATNLRTAGPGGARLMGTSALNSKTFLTKGGQFVIGDLCTAIGYPVEALPDSGQFVAAYRERYARTPGKADAYAYDAAEVLIAAVATEVRAHGGRTLGTAKCRARITANVAATNLTGATGPIRFAQGGDRVDPKVQCLRVAGGAWQHNLMP